MYARYVQSLNFKAEILHSSFGHKIVQMSGKGIGKSFKNESGKHICQRVPPTETKGRRHTSVVAVAVLPLPPEQDCMPLPDSELEVTTMIGTGPGGQHRQKTASCVRIKHKPTGITVVIDGRDQHQNRKHALRIITARVNEKRLKEMAAKYDANRKQSLANAGRGDKTRTYNFIDSRVTDHNTGKKTSNIKAVMKGELRLIL